MVVRNGSKQKQNGSLHLFDLYLVVCWVQKYEKSPIPSRYEGFFLDSLPFVAVREMVVHDANGLQKGIGDDGTAEGDAAPLHVGTCYS